MGESEKVPQSSVVLTDSEIQCNEQATVVVWRLNRYLKDHISLLDLGRCLLEEEVIPFAWIRIRAVCSALPFKPPNPAEFIDKE